MAATIALVPALHSSAALYAWTAALAFSNSIFGPAATGLVSVFADPTEQGTVLGAAQALAALGRLLGPLVMGEVYDVSRPAAFLVAGGVMALGGVACTRVPQVVAEAATGQTDGSTARRVDGETASGRKESGSSEADLNPRCSHPLSVYPSSRLA